MLKVEVKRGEFIESTHLVHARIEKSDGNILYSTSSDFNFFPRSAIKPFQSLLLLKSGACKALGLTQKHLALASASHAGQREHTILIADWLKSLGLNESNLRCGAHWPSDPSAADLLRENNLKPSPIHNNCSGKHTGFLSVCKHLNLPVENYHLIDHPLQQKLKETLEQELDCELVDYGIDGCSIPAFRMSFNKMSRGFSKMAGVALDEPSSPMGLIYQAFIDNPILTSGTEQYCAQVMIHNKNRIAAKAGAEGVLVGIIPEKKISILVKCQDGSHRGAQHAFDHLAKKYGGLKAGISTRITNWVGTHVGDIEVAEI